MDDKIKEGLAGLSSPLLSAAAGPFLPPLARSPLLTFLSSSAPSDIGFAPVVSSVSSLRPCSVLTRGGEHGVFWRRGAALPPHRPPLLRPQL